MTTIYVPSATGCVTVDGCIAKSDGGYEHRPAAHWAVDRFFGFEQGKKWFLDRDACLAECERLRLRKIASLEKQLSGLTKLGPFVAAVGAE